MAFPKTLTKDQRSVLQSALNIKTSTGRDQPITVMPPAWRARADQFMKSYATYCKQMMVLENAGLIEVDPACDSQAYVKDYDKVAALLSSAT